MVTENLNFFPAHKLNKMLKSREVSSLDIAGSVNSAIQKVQGKLNAYIRLEKEKMLEQAKQVDSYIGRGGEVKDFTGIPIAIKDNICTKGITDLCFKNT